MYKRNVRSGGALLWLFQRISGVYLAIVLFVHVILLHVMIDGDVNWGAVAERASSPMWKMINISFLVVALFHGLYGLWIVLDDYINAGWARILVFSLISVITLVFTIYGTITMLTLQVGG
ncbi:MAG: succinate dehydrogenase, hydrophobic membrane anchor protein [Candidatus Latescibacteria bacterium]|nr:succinate dehydrogenase, hydrophobic membrane anchor protein [bacterium]MBD3423914.1 succinate dehydrogenase, hydrophobic membrane anchor protein [Candidatus Latescibacterota bacterium]